MKAILKLVVVVLVANAFWRIGSAYTTFFRFKDSVRIAATDPGKSEDDLRQKILELASTYDVRLPAEAITIHREVRHTVVGGSYTMPIAVLPGFEYQWPFTMDVDALSPIKPEE
jgi:hypothetical protein